MRNFTKIKRVVIKIGTNTLAKNGGIDTAYVSRIAKQIKAILDTNRQVMIVTSGAIGMGSAQLKLTCPIKDTKLRQACAAIGQPMLMRAYRKAFSKYDVTIAQVLLTADVLNNRKPYLNLKNTIGKLLSLSVIPVINENDCVSTAEIGSAFGDNDKLSALVASKMDADLLIILSDIDALYDKDPRKNKDAKQISVVYEITPEIIKNSGGKGSAHATGGMKTKIEAAQIASNAGCRIVLANGRTPNIITKIIAGENLGTVFMPKRKLSNRHRWIINSRPAGTINIDPGAVKAIKNNKALLPSGITSIKGSFNSGDVIFINDIAKAVTNLSSTQLKAVAGKHSSEIKKLLTPDTRPEVIIHEDIVFLNY